MNLSIEKETFLLFKFQLFIAFVSYLSGVFFELCLYETIKQMLTGIYSL